MVPAYDRTIEILNSLIKVCADGKKGFQEAADETNISILKSFFARYSQQRGQFISALGAEVRRAGGKVQLASSAASAAHRGWMKLKLKLNGGDPNSLIAECQRGEEAAQKAYEQALAGPAIPTDIRDILQEQYKQIKETNDMIRSFEVETATH